MLFNSPEFLNGPDRTQQYQIEAERVKGARSSGSLDHFLNCSDSQPSWLLDSAKTDNIHSPVHSLREAAKLGIMEVYKYYATHVGEAGARITGTHLNGILERWQEANPTMSAPP